jgi:hypothetical protein
MTSLRVCVSAALALTVFAGEALAQASSANPRMPDGRPDFHGVWTMPWTTTLERDPGFPALTISAEQGAKLVESFISRLHENDPLGATYIWDLDGPVRVNGEIRSSLIIDPPDGRLPYTPEGRARRAAFRPSTGEDNIEQRALNERCLMAGSGYAPFLTIPASNIRQVVQTRDHIVFFTESFGQLRLIPLDGRSGPSIPRGGSSKGRWDGETLVVETSGFPETDRIRFAPLSTFAISPATRIIERFTFQSSDEILYRFTVDDSSLYTRPWTAESVLKRSSDRVFEWACHEGNYGLANILRGARVTEERMAGGNGRRP